MVNIELKVAASSMRKELQSYCAAVLQKKIEL